ncbi:MAG: FAD-dependent oxidoreductase [Anaerolineales bacterium]|nr:FAD-dependent oxidoreductase [Anaerolineales bacterium]
MMAEKQAETIVIGAGMAGIMAARTLQAAGREVLVLEARPRVGGRTHTDYSLGTAVDLGAAWIHGADGNPLLPYAKKYGIDHAPTDFINRSRTAVQAYAADGRPLDMDAFTDGQWLANGAWALAHGSLLHPRPDPAHRTLREFLENDLPRPADLSPDAEKGFYYWSTVLYEYLCAADWDTIDVKLNEGQHFGFPGGDLLLYGGGYTKIIERFVAELAVVVNTAVESITLTADGVRLQTNNGDYTAQNAIVTVPLGVLKAGHLRFEPALPPAKQQAIQRIGFGHYEKLALRFDQFYWPRDKQRFNYISTGEPTLFNVWLNTGHYTGEPVIVAYHAGRRARRINEWDDATFVAEARRVMQRIFGDNGFGQIPEPEAYVRTTWQQDPFSNGSYSFDQIGQLVTDRETLAEPVGQRLFFAGEATHPHFYASVHGAYETGIRAAQEVLGAVNCEL